MYYELYLPFPPTVNNYYKRTQKSGVYISNKGRKFRDDVALAVRNQLMGVHIDDRLLVEVVLFPPDRRTRAVDNYNKGLMDSLTEAGLWSDDKLVDQLFIYRGEVRSRQGSCYVRITDAGPIIKSVDMLPID